MMPYSIIQTQFTIIYQTEKQVLDQGNSNLAYQKSIIGIRDLEKVLQEP
jgi:hypothetical protein